MSQLYPVFNKSSWKELQHNSNKKREADHTEHLFLLAESEDFTSLKKEKNLSSHINDLHNHRTLLHVACRLKNVEMVEYFLSFPNIDVNKGISKEPEEEDYCEEEESPLYLACEKNFLKIAKLLLSHPSIDVGKGSSVSVSILHDITLSVHVSSHASLVCCNIKRNCKADHFTSNIQSKHVKGEYRIFTNSLILGLFERR